MDIRNLDLNSNLRTRFVSRSVFYKIRRCLLIFSLYFSFCLPLVGSNSVKNPQRV